MFLLRSFLALALFSTPLFTFAGNLNISPTTTLDALTSNNTSASNSFPTANGNRTAGNVSKVNVHSLLYPGATTKVFAHVVLWFGKHDHMDIGYSSTDAAQVKRQITDMISRGIDGVVMVWYGPTTSTDKAAQLIMNEAEQHPGFTFALMIDHGAILWHSCPGCSPQQALQQQLQYIEQTYFQSPAYYRFNGQPVVTNFDIDLFYKIDWNALKSSLPSNPNFIFQNTSGFSHPVSDGAYSWVMPTSSAYGLSYLKNFYEVATSHPGTAGLGAAYKGFNDSLASWTKHRNMGQQCGQTWLQTFSEINGLHNSTNQLPAMQLVTWNDYEEGTEIESGIDNCVSVSASVSSNSLNWNIQGNENTIDHYTVFVSADGKNVMPLQDEPAGTRSLDVCSYSLAAGNYSLYVQAIGGPSLTNHISSAVAYSPNCGSLPPAGPGPVPPSPPGPTPSPVPPPSGPPGPIQPLPPVRNPGSGVSPIGLASSPSSMTITRGGAGNLRIVVSPRSGAFNKTVSLACTNLPLGVTCSFSPSHVIPGSRPATSTLRISATSDAALLSHAPVRRSSLSLYGFLMSLPLGALVFGGVSERKRIARLIALMAIAGGSLVLYSCGGGTVPAPATEASKQLDSYQITIHAVAGTSEATTVTRVILR